MPYTVWGAFDTFRKNSVDLVADEVSRALVSRDYLIDQIKTLARTDAAFPRTSGDAIPYGSFARKTKIRPLDDVDLLLLLHGRGTRAAPSPNDPDVYWLKIEDNAAALAVFGNACGYVNSTKILNRIKSSLSAIPNYSKADIHRNMQAVTLQLKSYVWNFDIVPAVPIGDGTATIYYLIPDGHGEWIRTDPRIDQANITRVNGQHKGEFVRVVRLLKYWNRRTHKPRLPSYYFETLALRAFDNATPIADYPTAIKRFFDCAPIYLTLACPDPKGLGPALDANIDWETKSKVKTAMAEAAQSASYALMYKQQDKDKEAIYWWGQVFGGEFPNYG